jgi:2',3'-cyclic-nucleotide 2'-phosphodiesterase (5'-nucleotidase family)
VLGGLARRTAFAEKLRGEGRPVLAVDSGDLFFDAETRIDPQVAAKKAKVMGKAYRRMGVAAVSVGDTDLLHGLPFLQEEAAEGLPLISANLLDPKKKTPIFPPFVIREAHGLRVAFIGLTRPSLDPTVKKAVGGAAVIKAPVDAARETVAALRGKADLIALLSDIGLNEARDVAKAVPEIHFILGGHEARHFNFLEQEGRTWIGQSYYKGMSVGKLRLVIEEQGAPFQDEGAADRIQQHISNLGIRLRALSAAKERQPTESVQRQISQTNELMAKLEQDLSRVKEAGTKGNRFLWRIETLSSGLPEDEQVRAWIREAGVDKD